MGLPTFSNLTLLFAFIIPGFVTYQGIRLFSVRIARENRDFVLVYVMLSALNLAIVGLLIPVVNSSSFGLLVRFLALGAYVFVIPLATGVILGTLIQKEILFSLLLPHQSEPSCRR